MSEHYNIQVSVQKVTEVPVEKGQARGMTQQISGKERVVQDVAKIAVQADTEAEVFDRVQRILDATRGDKA